MQSKQASLQKKNLTRQKKNYSYESMKSDDENRRRLFRTQRQRANDQIRAEGRKTLALYQSRGMEDEFWGLVTELKLGGVCVNKKVYDMEGNLIPLIPLDEKNVTHSTKYNRTHAREIVNRVIQGETLKEICKSEHLPRLETVRKWYRDYPDFTRQLDQAYTERADYYVDQLYDLMKEVQEGKLGTKQATFVADQIKWMAERLNPKFLNKSKSDGINVQVNDDGKVQFQILLAPQAGQDDKRLAITGIGDETTIQSESSNISDD